MKKTVIKLFLGIDYKKEEAWINKMAADGWLLVKRGIARFVFEKGEPETYEYRMEWGQFPPKSMWGKDYALVQSEMGVVQAATYNMWSYWRRKKDGHPFDLFSDMDSQMMHLRRMLKAMVPIAMLFLVVGIMIIIDLCLGMTEWTYGYILWMGFTLLVAGINAIAAGRIWRKMRSLQRERRFRE